ncbi:MAG TPA: hypothetical protein VJO32_00265 [Ktedonobacteraceae bacterium]|nr:hypothetical protein [Ktedonobacteraceae bacterium]
MSAYRELRDGTFDSTDLDVHLEGCASCRQMLARDMLIGERLRALPTIEPPPEMHGNMMRALAQEHARFLQKASPGSVPTPEFLKPYLQEHAQVTRISNHLSALSTAETGPLPIIHAKRRRRPRSHMSQFAVIGVAAMFLMVLMMGGITSLLILAHDNTAHIVGIPANSAAIAGDNEIQKGTFATSTAYQHVASAVADRNSIYYTAYSDDTPGAWMLLQLDRATKKSTPLLEQPGDQPMIVLASTPQWLVWLQFDKPVARSNKSVPNTDLLPWSLRVLPLAQVAQSPNPITPTILLTGTFDQSTAPTWVHTPVQGVWLTQSVLLVTTIDAKGTSHLLEYQLDLTGKSAVSEITKADSGHILTSPTANSNATEIYWADEWMSDTGILSSNILMQQEVAPSGSAYTFHRRWVRDTTQTMQPGVFRDDGMSFRPQIADDTLFWLSTATVSNGNTPTGTPAASATPLTTATSQVSPTLIPRTDSSIYAPALDTGIAGQVFGQPLDSETLTPLTSLNNGGPAYALQVGSDFALWQNAKGYEMYDVPTQNDVTTGNTLNGASFLAVNGDSAVWLANNPTTNSATNNVPVQGAPTPVNFFAFNWPK